jgi:hypothetical protein
VSAHFGLRTERITTMYHYVGTRPGIQLALQAIADKIESETP